MVETNEVEAAHTRLTRPVLVDPVQQRLFERNGYVVVDLLDPDEVAALVETYTAAANNPAGINDPGAYNDTYAEFTVIHSRPDFRKAAFEAIDAVVGPKARSILADYRSLVGQFVNKPPGTGVVPAHQNWSVVDEARYQSVSVWVALVDCTTANGTLLFADGSHKALRGPRGMWAYEAFSDVDDDHIQRLLTPVEVTAGQAIVLDDATIHYSAPNKTSQPRLAIQYVMLPVEADPLFFQQTGEVDGALEVDVWRVEPEFFFNFWHGDGDPAHGEVLEHIHVARSAYDLSTLQALIAEGTTDRHRP